MRKLILLCFLTSISFAGGINRIWDDEGDRLDIKAHIMGIYSINCDTTTATAIRAANADRKGISIYNNGSYTVYLSTYAATSNLALYLLKTGAEFNDNGIQCYTGAWYGLGTTAAVNVRVIEKE